MAYKQTLVLLLTAYFVYGQRPSFAGTKPIGFPEVVTPDDPLGNRFGDDDTPLPVEAKGDRALVERLSKLPIDKQPFWFINWKAIEAANKNPQTYPQRENSFVDNSQAQSQSTNFQSNQPSQSNIAADSTGLASKFGETNNSGVQTGASGNSAGAFNNNRPNQHGYYERLG